MTGMRLNLVSGLCDGLESIHSGVDCPALSLCTALTTWSGVEGSRCSCSSKVLLQTEEQEVSLPTERHCLLSISPESDPKQGSLASLPLLVCQELMSLVSVLDRLPVEPGEPLTA